MITLTLFASIFSTLTLIPTTRAQGPTTLKILPTSIDLDPGNVVGQNFSVAVVIEEVVDLYAFDIRIRWNTTYLNYTSHTTTFPKEDYPTPIPPSPYAGILWEGSLGLLVLMNEVNTAAGTYGVAASSLGLGTEFDGNGTVFVMTFEVINQPEEEEGEANVILDLVFTRDDVSDPSASNIPHEIVEATVTVPALPFTYPPLPLIKLMPENIADIRLDTSFTADVYLMGEGDVDLDAFWDVAGFDVYVNFNTTLLEATDITIDPDGWFSSFYPSNLTVASDINNTLGTVHAAFLGYGEPHTPPNGSGILFDITFKSIYESDTLPVPSEPIYLENPITFIGGNTLDSIGGLIDITDPVGTEWFNLTPGFGVNVPYTATAWDDNGDGELSPSDQILLEGADGFYFNYNLDYITGTLNLTQLPFPTQDVDWLAMDGPSGFVHTSGASSGLGNPYYTGNFSLTYPAVNVNYFEVNPQSGLGASYNLTEGVDFILNPDGTIDLLNDLDIRIENEFVGTMPNVDLGWPAINYTASGFESVYLVMPNGTSRYARHIGYALDPATGNEFWYDENYPQEIESWWASGYYGGSWVWPDDTDIYINYTAASFCTIDYNAPPDPNPRYIEFNGSYANFMTTLSNPVNSTWDESYPRSLRDYAVVGWTDSDTSGNLTVGDLIDTVGDEGNRTYIVNDIGTDIGVSKKTWICNDDPNDTYFGMEPIVTLAGFTHTDRAMCPWHRKPYSVPLPHKVENATYTARARDLVPPSISDVSQDPQIPDDLETVTITANVTDTDSGVYNVTLSYSTDSGQTWNNVTMQKTTGDTYQGEIPGLSAGTYVQYKITSYDNAGNPAVEDNAGSYYVYTIIPEFPSAIILPLFMLFALIAVALAKKNRYRVTAKTI